ncbi:NLI interacting factor-like phosphatase family protein, putative [Ichthyophthirius multifiliis]|uniref:NLI interacting factor-like phosphatase family protein, putative n=1 Tax=Ichthyophthirius multifiliis TaxID=5932 RepID=G0QLX6_ICHMU|nr:NLI interacting factor-like phosphatase family protein, putative [Ichthyophthirius multifiliis]EGR33782.1 NLI interacting factor-like phosphatase family protein, putative [Ichthyophthirius multifiliis]|eukprot:XP_004039006.1 NLI interacting factor-like phosphatase family protein, putative [Ichthyophthirius multifiliis]
MIRKSIYKQEEIVQINQNKLCIYEIKKNRQKTLVFDLDETLIHCNENVQIPSDVVLPIKFPTGEIIEAGINIRPYCYECLQELSKYYEIVVFTASHSCYANVVLDYLDPKGQYISYRLYRENCVTTEEGVYIKDLRVLQNRNMSDIVLVDNAAYSFGFQINNGIPVIPFYDNKNDNELKNLINFMKSIHQVKDFRDTLKKVLKINQFSEFQDPEMLLSTLFQELIQ